MGKEKTWVPRQSLSFYRRLQYCSSLSNVNLAVQAVSTLPWRTEGQGRNAPAVV